LTEISGLQTMQNSCADKRMEKEICQADDTVQWPYALNSADL